MSQTFILSLTENIQRRFKQNSSERERDKDFLIQIDKNNNRTVVVVEYLQILLGVGCCDSLIFTVRNFSGSRRCSTHAHTFF